MRKWLKEQRVNHSLTQLQVAEKLGITEAYYSYIEKGERQKRMDITLVSKLSKIFSLPIRQIVEWEAE